MQVSERLLARGDQVVVVDALTPYYDPALKRGRLNYLKQDPGFTFYETDLMVRGAGLTWRFISSSAPFLKTSRSGYSTTEMRRDFTCVDDIAEGVLRTLDRPAAPNPAWDPEQPEAATSSAPYRIYIIGNNKPVNLRDFVL